MARIIIKTRSAQHGQIETAWERLKDFPGIRLVDTVNPDLFLIEYDGEIKTIQKHMGENYIVEREILYSIPGHIPPF